MKKKKLSDVIDYGTHIKPYRVIDVVSGIGSGKNYWVENVLMKQKRVLLITSRKSKVSETMVRTGLDNSLNFITRDTCFEDSYLLDDTLRGSSVCNSWHIEHYMKHKYISGDKRTYLWEFFDVIVVDEAHSLATDTSYCDAPFYLLEFIKAVYYQSNKKIIMMTATHNPINGLLKFTDENDYVLWDFTEQCTNIIPSKLYYYAKEQALKTICKNYKSDIERKRHVIYFATRTQNIRDDIVPFLIENGIPEESIAVSFSNSNAEEGFSEILLQNKTRVESYLSENEDIPSDISVFITTSRNKEGINIKNENYKWDIVIESHWADEIRQMWGRVRSKISNVILIYDAPQHQSLSLDTDFDFAFDIDSLPLVNDTFDSWCENRQIPLKNRWHNEKASDEIEKLQEKRFPYLRYSPYDDKFHVYKGKILGLKSYETSKNIYEKNIQERIDNGYYDIDIELFTAIKSYVFIPPSKEAELNQYITSKGYLTRPLSAEDRQDLLDYINKSLRIMQKKNKPYSTLSKAIKKFGYCLKECSKHKGSKMYGYYRLEKIE